jgi:hypothetical protein
VQAYRDHAPSEAEARDAAAYWLFVLHAYRTGSLSPVFLESRLSGDIRALTARYPSFFTESADGRATLRLASIRSSADFACGSDCRPSSAFFREAVLGVLGPLGRDLQPLALGRLAQLADVFVNAAEGKRAAGSIADAAVRGAEQGLTPAETSEVLGQIAQVLVSAGQIAGAAAEIGLVTGGAATVASAIGVVAAAASIAFAADSVAKGFQLYRQCSAWKAENCPCDDQTDGTSCGGAREGEWSACTSGDRCATTGTRTRVAFRDVCRAHACVEESAPPPEEQACELTPPADCTPLGRPGDPCGTTVDCEPSSVCFSHYCVGQGSLRVSLAWSADSDFDLYVQTPSGARISYRTRSADGGHLDVDQCVDACGVGAHAENVVFATQVPSGTYAIWVENYDGRSGGEFAIEVAGNALSTSFTGALPASSGATSPTFTVTAP